MSVICTTEALKALEADIMSNTVESVRIAQNKEGDKAYTLDAIYVKGIGTANIPLDERSAAKTEIKEFRINLYLDNVESFELYYQNDRLVVSKAFKSHAASFEAAKREKLHWALQQVKILSEELGLDKKKMKTTVGQKAVKEAGIGDIINYMEESIYAAV